MYHATSPTHTATVADTSNQIPVVAVNSKSYTRSQSKIRMTQLQNTYMNRTLMQFIIRRSVEAHTYRSVVRTIFQKSNYSSTKKCTQPAEIAKAKGHASNAVTTLLWAMQRVLEWALFAQPFSTQW